MTDSVAEVDTLGCPSPWFNGPPLIPPHFKNCRTLAVDTFIDIVGQNWFGIARLGTPLQQTVVQRGPLPRWPQLSRVAWARENVSVSKRGVVRQHCNVKQTVFPTINSSSFVHMPSCLKKKYILTHVDKQFVSPLCFYNALERYLLVHIILLCFYRSLDVESNNDHRVNISRLC